MRAFIPPMVLPIDVIITEILPKLPSITLQRFKCVCKSFKTTISSPDFINNYLQLSLSSDKNCLLILPRKNDLLYSYNFDSPESPVINNLSLPQTLTRHTGFVSVIGSCNGLLCIAKGYALTRHFLLLNPSSGSFWEIPFAKLQVYEAVLSFGFGYFAAIDDYKIVSVVDYVACNAVKMRGVVVYSLRSGSWRWVDSITRPQDDIIWSSSVVFLGNDLLHWVFWGSTVNSKRIGSFDIGHERWREDVLMPAYYDGYDLYKYETYLHDLGVLDGCLCSTFENRRESNFDVWVMKEYGVNESWLGLFSIRISSLPGKIFPSAYRRGSNDQVLLWMCYPTGLFWYEISCDAIDRVELNKVPALSNLQAWICIGSLGGDQIDAAV